MLGYPTVPEARFEQEIVFEHDGRPFLSYRSRTWLIDDDAARLRPSGTETGFWRPGSKPRDVELLIAHPTGFVELSVGEVVFHRIEVVTDLLARSETAKEVTALKRLYGLVEGDLAYAVDMAAVGQAAAAAPERPAAPGSRLTAAAV